ncbi:glycosyltransferase [Psychromonas arctica]|uniref:glycosyltransferase n=1 Tax=Psychromonas arctica TaxID=168275 RepID=UPI00041B030E|nr:glycosyltransferase [Psychromonas arctica]
MYKIKIFFGRTVLFSLYSLIRLFSLLPTKKSKETGNVVVLTGIFYSKNWIDAHLIPLVTCASVKHVYIVSNIVDYELEGLTIINPPPILASVVGATLARLSTFFICTLKNQPDYIGGFHILFNATLAILFAKIFRCRSIYFSGGGITETLENGKTENDFFKFLKGKDEFITDYICKIIACASRVITMGKGAKLFFSENGTHNNKIHIISGSIDRNQFYFDDSICKEFDIVLTARLSQVKQVDLYLDIIKEIKERQIICRALVIGDGPLLSELKEYAKQLCIEDRVYFAGHQSDVLPWLQKSKLYLLTSQSEGLSLSMLEGLKVGLPAIVPNVGDLSDVLVNNYNGYLIENHDVEEFSKSIIKLIQNPDLLSEYSANAIESTRRFDLACVQQQWNKLFTAESN